MAKQKLYLSSWINFGKYRSNPRNLKSIIDTEDGRNWVKWMIEKSWCFEFDHTVKTYLELKKQDDRHVLQQTGSK